jgi:phospholipid-binding lipoprotein MlaA
MGIEARKEDLDQAMAKHGVKARPHIVLPLLCPSNLRDATGTLATSLTNPLPLEVGAGQGLVKLHDNEKEIKSTRDSSLDGYIAKRKAYSRYCASQIRKGHAEWGTRDRICKKSGRRKKITAR